MDPSLPFHYHTSVHQHFFENEMPSFNEPKTKQKQDRAQRHELMAGNVSHRASFPVSTLSVKAQFHNVPVNLPPPITASTQEQVISEHSYI